MGNYDFQFVNDSGRIDYICASCRKEAINIYCSNFGLSEDFVKEHCIVRKVWGKICVNFKKR